MPPPSPSPSPSPSLVDLNPMAIMCACAHKASNGLFDTRIKALGCVNDACDHVFVSAGGIYESTNGGGAYSRIPCPCPVP